MKINYFTLGRGLCYVLLFLSYTLPAQAPWIDVAPGSGDGNPATLFISNGVLYFVANSPTLGQEPYKVTCAARDTDPTDNITDLVAGSGSSGPFDFTTWNNGVYFVAFSESTFSFEVFNYEADCSITGMPFNSTSFGTFSLSLLTPADNFLFLLEFGDLVRVDMMGNIVSVLDANSMPITSVNNLTSYNSDVFFNSPSGGNSVLMQVSDPSIAEASPLLDNIGESIISAGSFTESGGNLYFIGDSPTSGSGVLYSYDGVNPPFVVMNGGSPIIPVLGELTDGGGILYAFDNANNIYAIDGGTVTQLNVSATGMSCDGSSSMNAPSGILSTFFYNGSLLIITATGLYMVNGSNEVQVFADGFTGIARITAIAGNTFYFIADSAPGLVLWSTDGVSCPDPVMQDGTITDPTEIIAIPNSNNVFFAATSTVYGNELFKASPSEVLAVEFIAFNAFPEEGAITLKWSTATEIDNAGFEVERSKDARSWEAIGFVKGSGTSNELQQYNFKDDAPLLGTSYYRLRQIDNDGAFSYSSIESVSLTNKELQIQSWPNPTQDILYYIIDTDDDSELYKTTLYNLTGTQVYTTNSEAAQEQSINIGHLPAGNYYLKVNSGTQQYIQRIVKF